MRLLLALCLLLPGWSAAQVYPSVKVERSNVDRDNHIYSPGRQFLYEFTIFKGGQEFELVENGFRDFELNAVAGTENAAQALSLTVIKPRLFGRTNKRQTEILYAEEPDPRSAQATGLVENDRNVWLHPPRSGFFRSLETCPFPYVQLPLRPGLQWRDSMRIGDHWSDGAWGTWENELALHYTYTVQGKETIDTSFGPADCHLIRATAESAIGATELIAYFSETHGFVRLEYTLATGLQVRFQLQDVQTGPVWRSSKAFLEARRDGN